MAGAFGGPTQVPMTEEEKKRFYQGALGGFADMGGATSFVADAAGYPMISEELQRLQSQSEGGSALGSIGNPLGWIAGPIADVGRGIKDFMNAPASEPPKAKTLDEYVQERRKPIPGVGDYEAQALERVRNSPAYKEAIERGQRTTAKRMLEDESKRAKANYQTDVGRIEAENNALPDTYGNYTKGINDQLESYYGQDFKDRNPGLSQALASAGPIIAGLLTRGAFKGVNKRMGKWADDANKASKDGNIADEAAALDKLQWWRDKGKVTGLSREVKAKGTGAALSATIPFDLQLYGDVVDRKGLSPEYQDADGNWQRSRAQQTAEEKLSDPVKYLSENLPTALVSGGVGAAVGSKFGGKSVADEATALLNPANPQRYADMAKRKIAAIEADKAVAAARNASGPAPSPGMGPTPPPAGPAPAGPAGQAAGQTKPRAPRQPAPKQKDLLSEFEKGLKNLEAGKPFAPKGGFMRGKDQASKDRVMKGADALGLTAPNASPSDVARARSLLSSGNLKLGVAGGATGYSALLAQRLAELQGEQEQ